LVSFVQLNEGEYGYQSDLILNELQNPNYQKRWKQLLKNVSEYPEK
jgi:hypothetical protein